MHESSELAPKFAPYAPFWGGSWTIVASAVGFAAFERPHERLLRRLPPPGAKPAAANTPASVQMTTMPFAPGSRPSRIALSTACVSSGKARRRTSPASRSARRFAALSPKTRISRSTPESACLRKLMRTCAWTSRMRAQTSNPTRQPGRAAPASNARRSSDATGISSPQVQPGPIFGSRRLRIRSCPASRIGEPMGNRAGRKTSPTLAACRVTWSIVRFGTSPRSTRLIVAADEPMARPTTAWLRPAATRARRSSSPSCLRAASDRRTASSTRRTTAGIPQRSRRGVYRSVTEPLAVSGGSLHHVHESSELARGFAPYAPFRGGSPTFVASSVGFVAFERPRRLRLRQLPPPHANARVARCKRAGGAMQTRGWRHAKARVAPRTTDTKKPRGNPGASSATG
jgi:hypothetical protein